MKYLYVIEPATHHIVTHVMQLRMDAEFAREYDMRAEACRATYNRAVAEAALDGPERLAHMSYVPKDETDGNGSNGPYLDGMSYRLAREVAGSTGADTSEIRKAVRLQPGHVVWCHAFPPNARETRNRIGLLPAQWRAEHVWMRECPVQYEPGAIREAVTAVDRSVRDRSEMLPFRPAGRHAPLFCPSNQAMARKGPRELRVPGFTPYTKKAMPKDWDIRSCRIVETTPYRTRTAGRGSRTFETHIQVRERVRRQPANVLARAVDAGGRHVAATSDTTRRTTIQTMPHTGLARGVRALQSGRDAKTKGCHAWLAINKRMRTKRGKSNRVARNDRLQGSARVVRGVLAVILEGINIGAMMARGGNRKRRLNDTLQLAGAGGFRGHIIRNAARRGAYVILVDAKNSSNECAICGHVDRKSRASRDGFICVNCGDEAHADINVACVLKRGICAVDRAEGRAVLRRRATPRNRPTQWSARPRKRGLDPPQMRRGRQKITQVEALPRL